MSKSSPQIRKALPGSGVTTTLCWHSPTWSSPISRAQAPNQHHSRDSLQSHFPNSAAVTPLEAPVFPGRTLECPGSQADWGGGGEIHAQVLSCLVVGTPEGVRPALQGTPEQIHPTAYAEPARPTLENYFSPEEGTF